MAPSEAASSLAQAYFGTTATAGDVASYFGQGAACPGGGSLGSAARHRPQSSKPTQLAASAQVALAQPLPLLPSATSMARGSNVAQGGCGCRSARGARQTPTAGSFLSGDWVPDLRAPQRAVSSDGAAISKDAVRLAAQRLQDGAAASQGSTTAGVQSAREGRLKDGASGGELASASCASSCAESQGPQGDGAASQLGTQLSHATTPSWRSRTFPQGFLARCRKFQKSKALADAPSGSGAKSRRLPQLPEEARPQKMAPPSEVGFLAEISSEVGEANALLVESYLNVKRRPMSRTGAASVVTDSSSASERSARPLSCSRPQDHEARKNNTRPGRQVSARSSKYEAALGSHPAAAPVACP